MEKVTDKGDCFQPEFFGVGHVEELCECLHASACQKLLLGKGEVAHHARQCIEHTGTNLPR